MNKDNFFPALFANNQATARDKRLANHAKFVIGECVKDMMSEAAEWYDESINLWKVDLVFPEQYSETLINVLLSIWAKWISSYYDLLAKESGKESLYERVMWSTDMGDGTTNSQCELLITIKAEDVDVARTMISSANELILGSSIACDFSLVPEDLKMTVAMRVLGEEYHNEVMTLAFMVPEEGTRDMILQDEQRTKTERLRKTLGLPSVLA